ncbi:hypothetical protein FVE85_0386 [Porphyridium purpureum]|uniref:Uncharacterized protein n=1 Tax=Porphyridium purpureum TaxID=35688 RepID=A0A5J4Z1U4_PORPP|nr:hypothetical protein FVE85_0386 [Porphyridium purpureum]|eukprot:POR4339..scf208_2
MAGVQTPEVLFFSAMAQLVLGALAFSDRMFDEDFFRYKVWNLYVAQGFAAILGICAAFCKDIDSVRPDDKKYLRTQVFEIFAMVMEQAYVAYFLVRSYVTWLLPKDHFLFKYYAMQIVLHQAVLIVLVMLRVERTRPMRSTAPAKSASKDTKKDK